MGSGIASGHPTQELSIVDDEVGECELVRVEEERSNAKSHDGDPAVDQVRHPDCKRGIQQKQQCTHTEVDTWTSKPRVKQAERYPGSSERSTSGDISCSTESQVGQDGMRVNLCGEHLEYRGCGRELLRQT